MTNMTMAKMTRWVYGPGFIATKHKDTNDGEIVAYQELKIFVPTGEEPEVRDLTEAELEGVENLIANFAEVPRPKQLVLFKRAIVFMDETQDDRISGLTPLALYVQDGTPIRTEVEPLIPQSMANGLIGAVEGEDRDLNAEETGLAIGALVMYLKQFGGGSKLANPPPLDPRISETFAKEMREFYGDEVPMTTDDKDDEEFVLVKAAKFKGKVGMMARKGNEAILRTNSQALFFMAADGSYERTPVPPQVAHDLTEMSDGTFVPVEKITLRNVGLLEHTSDGAGMAMGDFDILVEAGTTLEQFKAWAPLTPFKIVGITSFFDHTKELPDVAEVQRLRDEHIADPVLFGTVATVN